MKLHPNQTKTDPAPRVIWPAYKGTYNVGRNKAKRDKKAWQLAKRAALDLRRRQGLFA